MSELQIGLLAIGALVVAGVLAYNRVQERRARRAAERAFGSGHEDVLMGRSDPGPARDSGQEAAREVVHGQEPPRHPERESPPRGAPQPDPKVDYIVELSLDPSTPHPAAEPALKEQWGAIERRHAHRALLAGAADGRSWRAALQLVSRDGAVGEADLIEFRSAVETMAAAMGATVSAPEMRAAVETARLLDEFCAEADIQVVMHVGGGPFPGTKIRAAAEASGLALEADGRFALRNDEQTLLYTLGARDGAVFSAATMRDAAPVALTLALDLARTPDTRRSFESMTRLAHHLASVLGGSIVDDNGNPLDDRAIAAIAQQLDAVCAKLESRGLPPGGPTALRLFS
ncbi:MAG TPA: cell division protein ZipA C-terminal FtsZ-binding domain-containing protein [Burkholderiales bacterium]|nr:cell division protein ZipA C-terminal FtsZ-binding domain-containing protein [Burkholderiales bacterium]